jgi:hypothetical protein
VANPEDVVVVRVVKPLLPRGNERYAADAPLARWKKHRALNAHGGASRRIPTWTSCPKLPRGRQSLGHDWRELSLVDSTSRRASTLFVFGLVSSFSSYGFCRSSCGFKREKDLRLLFRLFLPHRPECVWALMRLTR